MPEQRMAAALRAAGEALARAAREHRVGVRIREQGIVCSAGDRVLRISGLPGATTDELLAIDIPGPGGTRRVARALVLGLAPDAIEAIALDEPEDVQVGATVRRTGRTMTMPAGEALLGRVIDPLGRPLDGLPWPTALHPVPLERRAPHIHERAAVHSPLYTGILAIDAMFPIGRGQRELLLGDEGTGKTSLAVDVLMRQQDTDVIGVYVAIGRRRADVWQIAESLRRSRARWVIVAAPEDASPGLRYLAPYAGTAVAEHFAYRGEHALIAYDDLTAHAVAWRELSLLLRRPPGREAYPGDVFYLHARLLERAAQLAPALGGGSLTAIPLAVLEAGRISAYIPTNLISITDGQIVLSQALFTAGQRPAIDAGLSVSRVGSKAQPQAFRELAGQMRLDYSAFLELEAFARLGTRLETSTQRRIDIGRRVRALLRQRRLEPLDVLDEVVRLVLAREHDTLLRIDEDQTPTVAAAITARARDTLPDLVARVAHDAVLTEADRRALADLVQRTVAEQSPAEPLPQPAPAQQAVPPPEPARAEETSHAR